jgi:hypothetical protein
MLSSGSTVRVGLGEAHQSQYYHGAMTAVEGSRETRSGRLTTAYSSVTQDNSGDIEVVENCI